MLRKKAFEQEGRELTWKELEEKGYIRRLKTWEG
jgi:hypothetical protein